TKSKRDWSSDVCSSDLAQQHLGGAALVLGGHRGDGRVVQQRAVGQRAVGLGGHVVLGVGRAQFLLVEQRVQLDLVDRRGRERQEIGRASGRGRACNTRC